MGDKEYKKVWKSTLLQMREFGNAAKKCVICLILFKRSVRSQRRSSFLMRQQHRTGVKLSSTHLNIKDYSVHSRLILFHSLMRDVARSKQRILSLDYSW